ncbi:MAG: hypothetical protein ACFE9L_13425 [Candidatus Hodarchaeota archaeon]
MQRFNRVITFIFFSVLLLYPNLIPIIASNPIFIATESFEDYPIGSYSSIVEPYYTFESWFPLGADSPTATIVNNQSQTGEQSVRIFMDGSHDDGSIWFLKAFSVDNNIEKMSVKLRGSIWSSVASDFNTWPIIAFIDTYIPISNNEKQEEDFQIIGQTEYTMGWTSYEYTQNIIFQETNTFYVAFGISVWWETERVYWVDDLEIHTLVLAKTSKNVSSSYLIVFISALIFLPYIKKKL